MSTIETQSEYDIQAETLLSSHGLKFRATLSDTKTPAWKKEGEKTGHHYRVTLSKSARIPEFATKTGTIKDKGARLTFDFWGSINDAKNGKHPTPYGVLACISGDVHCPETFADFCAEYGYETDSIQALQTFRRCSAFAKRLRAFFTEAELEALSEIQ